MRVRALLVAALLAAGVPGAASAEVVQPKVAIGSCELDVTNGDGECIVQVDVNAEGVFIQSTWSGYGVATLQCFASGRTFHIEGGYGTGWEQWDHGPDVCRMTLRAIGGRSTAWVD